MTFKELEFRPHNLGEGVWASAFFPNGFGASVICCPISYGWPSEYEVAVMRGSGVGECKIDTTTHLTDDVVGHLTPDGVTDMLRQISALPDDERVGDDAH